MITIDQLRHIIKDDETQTLELKKSTGELKDAMHSACAFLNSDGGWLVFGITPKSLKIIGQDVTDNTRQEISMALNGIEPCAEVDVNYIKVDDETNKCVIAIHFEGWTFGKRPYTYRGCPYYRVESTTRQMSRDMFEERLKESNPLKFAWDVQVAHDVCINNISEERIRSAVRLGVRGNRLNISAEGDEVETLLEKFNLLKFGKLTNAAIMLFGKDVVTKFPQLFIKMARFRGSESLEFIDMQRVEGNFFDLLDAGVSFCFKHLNLGGEIVGLIRKESLEIPIEALREALINALCHRDYEQYNAGVSLAIYDDRVEIYNPGRLPNQLNKDTIKLPHDSFPRNRSIANVLFRTTYLESWGTGIGRMIEHCKRSNVSEPEFVVDEYSVKIIFRRSIDSRSEKWPEKWPERWPEKATKILELMKQNPSVTYAKIETELSVGHTTIKKIIKAMQDMGVITRVGPDRGGEWLINSCQD